MATTADVCLIVEGGYPYIIGGVGSWMDALMRTSAGLTFHVIAISIGAQQRVRKYQLPPNVLSVSDIILDRCAPGRSPSARQSPLIARGVRLLQSALSGKPGASFDELISLVRQTGFGERALLDSKPAWMETECVYQELMGNGGFIDFFWSWRFLARSLLAIISAPLPRARVYHAVATGYAGLVGAYAKRATQRPCVLTEHGIYTNERRIELSIADWLFDSGAGGFAVREKPPELRDFWMTAFTSFSRIAYAASDAITTQYRANQDYQRADGAPEHKLRIIQNGIDAAVYAGIRRDSKPRRPTVLMIGRVVPIKDTRTFIMAIDLLRRTIPQVEAIVIGPEEEDPGYAAGCRELVAQFGLQENLHFAGRVPDVKEYLARADVLALTSISEAQPIALLEAAASGLPAVVTDVGSCRDIIEGFADDPVPGRGGFVVAPCDAKGAATALATLLTDDALRARMGEVMRRRVPSLYGKDRIRRLYEGLYRELAGGDDVRAA